MGEKDVKFFKGLSIFICIVVVVGVVGYLSNNYTYTEPEDKNVKELNNSTKELDKANKTQKELDRAIQLQKEIDNEK